MTVPRRQPTASSLPNDAVNAGQRQSRRCFLQLGAAAAAGLAVAQFGRPHAVMADEPSPMTGDEALARLLDGNGRFAAGQPQHANQSLARLTAVAAGQQPFAFVLGC